MAAVQIQAVKIETPLTLFEIGKLLPQEYLFLLESSSLSPAPHADFSFAGAEPYRVIQSRGGRIAVQEQNQVKDRIGDPLQVLQEYLTEIQTGHDSRLPPFQTGVVGFFSYDLGRQFETLPSFAKDDLGTPDLYFAFYDVIVAMQQSTGSKWILMALRPGHEQQTLAKADRYRRLIEQARLPVGTRLSKQAVPAFRTCDRPIRSTFTRETYIQAVKKAIEYIYAGDVFQVNLSQRFAAEWNYSPLDLHQMLRSANPVPFSAYLDCGSFAVVSSSPERFLHWRTSGPDAWIETRPIKGTRPRGKSPGEDAKMRAALWESQKDQAELAMIVDLLRNDLGRICRYGSVAVSDPRRMEEFASVFHTVATITGEIRPDCTLYDVIKATFPGGSITGAPKIRAMEIIEELEPVRRGVYCGAIGYIGVNQTADFNIAIRTFVIQKGIAYFHAGGGIVADSDPAEEYEETLHKVRRLFDALGIMPDSSTGIIT